MILVKHILEGALKRLAVLSRDAPVCEAAGILANPATPLVVVCDSDGIAIGVISKSNIVKALARAQGDATRINSGAVMTSPILSCHEQQALQVVWNAMNARSVRSIPVLDELGRPRGIVHARDLAHALLDEAEEEEVLMRDYILGIGYQ
jgi:CBS domain-containing protein